MFAAPVPALRNALSIGSLGDLNPLPWAFMTGNTCGWVAYSFLTKDVFVLIGNAPSFLLSLWLNVGASQLQYLSYIRAPHGELRSKTSLLNSESDEEASYSLELAEEQLPYVPLMEQPQQQHQQGGVIASPLEKHTRSHTHRKSTFNSINHTTTFLIIGSIWLILLSIVAFLPKTINNHSTQVNIIGIAANINLVFFLGAPLSTIMSVVQHRNSSSIHRRTMMTSIANCSLWSVYGLLAVGDPFIYVPNFMGLMLGIVQGLLCLCFPMAASAAAVAVAVEVGVEEQVEHSNVE